MTTNDNTSSAQNTQNQTNAQNTPPLDFEAIISEAIGLLELCRQNAEDTFEQEYHSALSNNILTRIQNIILVMNAHGDDSPAMQGALQDLNNFTRSATEYVFENFSLNGLLGEEPDSLGIDE
ncbi:MAG: hypothetical protein K0Q51_1257 [Rickettsiaceae bacterium]|jgi:hypothetical protein|nr:hypothetical protein [Rickettsiaceae bacterium]